MTKSNSPPCAAPRPTLQRPRPAAALLVAAMLLLTANAPLVAQAQGLRAPGRPGPAISAPLRPASTAPRQADFIVAVVNSEPITNNEVLARLGRAEQQMAQQGGQRPPRDVLARQVLEGLINEKAQLQLAREYGLKVDEAAVDQAALGVANQNQISVAELERRLQQDGISLARFRDELRNQLLLTRLREREVDPKVRVTDLDIDQFMQEKQGAVATGNVEINLAHVLVVVPENADAAQVAALQARAERAAARARAGEDFAALARELSDAPDRDRTGGQLGLRSTERYPPLFVETTRTLPVGGIGGPIRTGAGFHVLKVVERSQGSLATMTVTQHRARHILLRPGAELTEAAAVARLTDFRRRVLAGEADFAALARENSQDGSAREGGDLGWVGPGQFVPEFEQALNRLAPGQISQPLVSRFGVHLIQLMERRESKLTEREQREIVRNMLREKKAEEVYTSWAQDVRGRAYVEFREPPQ